MNKIIARLARLASTAAACGVLLTSGLMPASAEYGGTGSPGLPPPPPKITDPTLRTSSSMAPVPVLMTEDALIYSDGLALYADGSFGYVDARDDSLLYALWSGRYFWIN